MADQVQVLFDLTLTDEQKMMRDSCRRFAQQELRAVSRKADEAAAAPDGLFARAGELGFTAVPIAEAQGGLGGARSPVSNVLIAEDLAYGDLSLALGAMTSLSFVNTVLDAGTPAQQAALLPPLAEQAFHPACVALMEPTARFDARKLATKARKAGGGYVLNGKKTMVPHLPG
jgi:alkylation response protein AidB-like acyl-CoA dehydrogenase